MSQKFIKENLLSDSTLAKSTFMMREYDFDDAFPDDMRDYYIVRMGSLPSSIIREICDLKHKHIDGDYVLGTTPSGVPAILPNTGIFKLKDDKGYFVSGRKTGVYNEDSYYFIAIAKRLGEEVIISFFDDLIDKMAEHFYAASKETTQGTTVYDRLVLNDGLKEKIFSSIDMFIESRNFYEKFSLAYKFGILLGGPPGNGKTTLIKAISEFYGAKVNDLTDYIGEDGKIYLPEGAPSVGTAMSDGTLAMGDAYRIKYGKDIEDAIPSIYYLEDMEKLVAVQGEDGARKISLSSLLSALDGVDEIHNVIVIGTSNNVEQLNEALARRPGRFDLIVDVDKPSISSIKDLMKRFDFSISQDPKSSFVSEDTVIDELHGMSMAFVEQFIKNCLITYRSNKVSISDASIILKEIKEHAKTSGGGLGFHNS